jgi:hypothetical protein
MALDPAFAVVEVDVPVDPELEEVVVPELPEAEGVPELFELHAARLSPVKAIINASVISRRPRGPPEIADPEITGPGITDMESSLYRVLSRALRFGRGLPGLRPEGRGHRKTTRTSIDTRTSETEVVDPP